MQRNTALQRRRLLKLLLKDGWPRRNVSFNRLVQPSRLTVSFGPLVEAPHACSHEHFKPPLIYIE